MTGFDRAVFGQVDLGAPAIDPGGQPYWADDHNQPLTWADAFDLWEDMARHEAKHANDPPRDPWAPTPDGEPPF